MKFILKESKIDQEAFIDKFGKEVFDFFQKYKQRLINANVSTDITFHTKNTSKEEMNQIISDLENKVVKDSAGTTKLNRKYIGSGKNYEVYQPLDWETSMNMGEGTDWCITGRYQTEEVKPSQAKRYFNEYADNNIKFYFFMKNNKAEYCIALYPEYLTMDKTLSTNFELWDRTDENVTQEYSEIDLPYNLIPDLKIDIAKKIGNLYIKDNVIVSCEKDAKEVVIPDGITGIGGAAFWVCHNLKSVTIPDSVARIGIWAFAYCSSLTSITIPDSVTSIGEKAFYRCSSLTSATIDNGVTSIGNYAFWDCSSLTSVTIGNSVASIGNEAFYNCDNLTSITFQGTTEQWNAITKGYRWDDGTENYTIYCTDGDISKHASVSESFKDTSMQNNSKLVEIYPDKGESKKDFISRFMSVTKDEYPDIKQRFAVANSYRDRRNK